MEKDYTTIVSELLISIRGNKSQAWLNNKLGYSYNQVSRWETASRRIHWSDFKQICKVSKINIDQAIKKRFAIVDTNIKEVPILIKLIVPNLKLKEISQIVDTSRFTISRWLKNETEPYLEHILKLIDYQSELFNVLDLLVGIENFPSLANEVKMTEKVIDLSTSSINFNMLLSCLDLSQYKKLTKHRDGFISSLIGITIEEEKEILDVCKRAGIILKQKNKYIINQEKSFSFGLKPEKSMQVKIHWNNYVKQMMEQSLEIPKASKNDRFTYQFNNVSSDAISKINEKITEFHNDIHNIIEKDTDPQDTVAILTVNLIDIIKK